MKNISVIGCGTMGNGIAHVFALAGFNVQLIDINEAALQKALQKIASNLDRQVGKQLITEDQKNQAIANITSSTELSKGVSNADLVIEAATENVGIKLQIFKDIDAAAPAHCILSSNTSSISLTKIAAVTSRPDKVIGMHFMNPVPVMKLVEVINGYKTSREVTETIMNLSKTIGKVPTLVNDYPGFVANRILMPMINEAIIALSEGVSDAATIDQIMKLGMAHPMGPLQLADYIGLDVCKNIMVIMQEGFQNDKYAPSPLLVQLVSEGKLGVKTGQGFYTY